MSEKLLSRMFCRNIKNFQGEHGDLLVSVLDEGFNSTCGCNVIEQDTFTCHSTGKYPGSGTCNYIPDFTRVFP